MLIQVVKTFREEGVSGKTTDRPQLQEMLRFVKDPKNKISGVIVYAFSRLNRNTLDYLTIRASLAKHNIRLYSVTEPSGDTPAEKMIETILASFNQYQNEERAQNVANSLKRRFFEGHITVKPPLGYLMQKINGKSIAVKDPRTFDLLKSMWYRIGSERLSLRQLAAEMNQLGLTPTHDSKDSFMRPQSAHKIFTNKFYCGILVSQKYGETQGKHEAMITPEVFAQVRAILESRRPSKHERYQRQRQDFDLKGILRCNMCGKKLTGAWSKGKRKIYAYYTCQTRGVHRSLSFKTETVRNKYLQLLDLITMNGRFMQWLGEMVIEKFNVKLEQHTVASDWVHKDIEKLTQAKDKLVVKHSQGFYTDEEYYRIKTDFEDKIMVKKGIICEHTIDKLEAETAVGFVQYYFSHIRASWENATLEGKLILGVRMFPKGLVFDGNKFRTPELDPAYALTARIATGGVKIGEPRWIRTINQQLKRLLLCR